MDQFLWLQHLKKQIELVVFKLEAEWFHVPEFEQWDILGSVFLALINSDILRTEIVCAIASRTCICDVLLL